jgi:hypothetical protein
MLRRENELRLSEETQEKYAAAEASTDTDWLAVTEALQKQVVMEFGYDDSMEDALYCLRCASQLYPNDPAMKEIPLYVKYNRARDGQLKEGDEAPNTVAVDLNGTSCKLLDCVADTNKPLVVVAGSYS